MLTCKIFAQKPISLTGTIDSIPADKSISHRAFILGALCDNVSLFSHVLESEDCLNTRDIMRALGVSIEKEGHIYTVTGVGLKGLRPVGPGDVLDVGNSGTSIRLLTGLLAAQSFDSVITGDHSIQGRPMRRVTDPLSQMGARISGQSKPDSNDLYPPLHIKGIDEVSMLTYDLPIASAQVKSALLLAGLYSECVSIEEPDFSRDHTERMLRYFGADLTGEGKHLLLKGPTVLSNPNPDMILRVPGDMSSALFFIVFGVLLKKSQVTLTNIGSNQTRNAALDCIRQMHGKIYEDNLNDTWEPTLDIEVHSSDLFNIAFKGDVIPNVIDEIPILSILGVTAKGVMTVRDAQELRVKESDRISAIVRLIEAMGCEIKEYADGFDLPGEQTIQSFTYHSGGDHRMAMSAIIAALSAGVEATVENCDCIATSFPNFFDILRELGLSFELIED